MFIENHLSHQLILTTKQKTKLRNALENNMSTNVELPKTQKAKIIQFGRFLDSLLSKLAAPLMTVEVPLT